MALSLAKKLSVVIATVFLTATAFGDTQCGAATQPSKGYDQGYEVGEGQMASGYNAPARFDVQGSWDFFVTGSFLYWEAREKGLDFGYIQPADPTTASGSVQNMEFEYKPGFQVGLGMNFDHDNWDLFLEYTRYNMSTTTKHFNTTGNTFYLNFFDTLNQGSGSTAPRWASATWEVDYNVIDLVMGRPFYNGTHLTFRPYYGVRGGWFDQEFHFQANFGSATVNPMNNLKQDSWFVGPRLGIDGNWIFGSGFRFFGNASASLLYQKFDDIKMTENFYNYTTTVTNRKNETNDIGYITPNVGALAGFGYGTYFDHNNWNFDLMVGYQIEYYFNQNMMRGLNDLVHFAGGSPDSDAGDYMMHGLTVRARFDF